MKDVRISPDRLAVAIASDDSLTADDMAYGVMHSKHGGHWASAAQVADWTPLTVPAADPPPADPAGPPQLPAKR